MAQKAAQPKGTRDFLPHTMRQRSYVIETIAAIYRKHGFEPIETPALENLDTLLGKYGEEGDQLLFRILKRGAKAGTGECDLGLRYDLTVPLARFIAMHQNDLPRIFKRYQIQPVWRADRPGHGRFREFYQCDIDVVGAQAPLADVDLLLAVVEVFDALAFNRLTLRLNDRRILRGLIEVAGIDIGQETTAIVALDKLDKIGAPGVETELQQRGIPAAAAASLLATLQDLQEAPEILPRLEALFADHPAALAGVHTLAQIQAAMAHQVSTSTTLRVDPTLARGLNYYTGPIFEIQSQDLGSSLAGGGRYDGLIGTFLGRDIPACGVSLGLERILVVMEERDAFPGLRMSSDLMVALFDESTTHHALTAATALRAHGLEVDLYPQHDKMAKQFKYANERKIPWVLVIGPDEAKNDRVRLKRMHDGTHFDLSLAEVPAHIASER